MRLARRPRTLKRMIAKAAPFLSSLVLSLFIINPSTFIAAAYGNSVRATVRVRAECTARVDNLTLGDIADVRSNDPRLAMQLRAITLGYAPQVGAVRELTKQRIALAISAAGFPEEVVAVEAPAITLIRREAQSVDPGAVRRAVELALVATLKSTGASVALTRLDLPSNLEVPTGVVEVRAVISPGITLASPFPVSLEFWIERRLVRRLNVNAQAEASGPVLVAVRDLGAKTRVREGDFRLETRPLVRNQLLYVSESTRLRGASLIHALASGEAITTDVLVADIVVKPGDPVRITGQSGALTVLVMGEARAAGHVGDRIQVKNLQSGLLFQAVIVDEGVVAVRF